MLPLKESGQSDLFGNDKTVLLAAGFLNLGDYGNLSSALYNGSAWIPYFSVSSDNGATNTLSNVFFKSYDVDLTRPGKSDMIQVKSTMLTCFMVDYLPAPIVVLVSVAGALGIVFLIVLCGLCILYAKRRKEAKVNPAGNPASYYGKPPQRPESVLAMINSVGAAGLMYDPKKGISDDTTIAGGGELYSVGKDKVPEMTETSNGIKSGAAAMAGYTAGVAAATAAATRDERPHDNYSNLGAQTRSADTGTRDMSSNNASYLTPSAASTGAAGAAVTASAVSGNRQSYNPFRASAVGLAVSNDWSDAQKINNNNNNYASRTITNGGQNSTYLGNLAPEPIAASSNVRWTNAPTAETTTAAIISDPLSTLSPSPVPSQVPSAAPSSTLTGEGAGAVRWTNVPSSDNMATATVGPVSIISTSPAPSATTPDENNPAAVRWTNVPALDGPATATVGPVSMYSTSSMLVTNDGQPASNVRWTNTDIASGAIGAAMVAPVIGGGENNNSTRSMANTPGEHEASNVRWTNYTTHEDQGVAMLRPVTAVSMYSDTSFDPTSEFGGVNNKNDLFATPSTRPSMTDFSSDPDIVRWTTAPNVDSAKATAIVTKDNATTSTSSAAMPVSETATAAAAAATSSSLASHQSRDMLRPSSESSMDHPRSIPRQYESGLDLASLTVSDISENDSNDKYSGVVTNERPLSHVDSSSSNNPYPAHNTKDMLSESAALASSSSAAVQSSSHSQPATAAEQQVSSQSYSESMMPSTYQPALTAMQPTSQSASEKKVSTEEEEEEKEVGDDKRDIESRLFKTSSFRWSETPSLPPIDTNLVFSAPSHPMSSPLGTPDDPSVRWKETHAASPIERGHAPQIIGASAATVTVTQAHRQLNDDDDDDDDTENSSNYGDQHEHDDTACQGRKNSLGAAAALDGRAASKRMVQDYFSSRDPALAGTKEAPNGKQYHKDFVAAMEAAALNNRDDLPSTEDHPHLYYAKFDFNAREHGELGFDKGDPIIVVDRSDDIWWMGYKDNGEHGPMQGVFPSNYVERASAS